MSIFQSEQDKITKEYSSQIYLSFYFFTAKHNSAWDNHLLTCWMKRAVQRALVLVCSKKSRNQMHVETAE